jgi:hypothetical protein
MPAIELAFRPAELRLLEISYHCDLTRSGGDVIPLGVLADISVDDVYGLGLAARRTLSANEIAKIGRLVRADLSAPFSYLLKVFNSVYENDAPIEAFAALADEHTHSLRFQRAAGKIIKLPRSIAANTDARLLWVKDQVRRYGDAAYWKLFGEDVPDVVDKGLKDEARELHLEAA